MSAGNDSNGNPNNGCVGCVGGLVIVGLFCLFLTLIKYWEVILQILGIAAALAVLCWLVSCFRGRRSRWKRYNLQRMLSRTSAEYEKRVRGAEEILALLDDCRYRRMRCQKTLVEMLDDCTPTGLARKFQRACGARLDKCQKKLARRLLHCARSHHVEMKRHYPGFAAMRRHVAFLRDRYQKTLDAIAESHYTLDDYPQVSREYKKAMQYGEE